LNEFSFTQREYQKTLRDIYFLKEYDTDNNDIINELYKPAFNVAIKYDRSVGYFRSGIYKELGEEIIDFVLRGGSLTIICSPNLSEEDENTLRKGYENKGHSTLDEKRSELLEIMKKMSENPDERECLEMLRILIEIKSLRLLVAIRSDGIYHRKIGRFTDKEGNYIVFSGSGNETEKAVGTDGWGNDEEFDLFRSWGSDFEKEKAQKKSEHIDNLIKGGSGRTVTREVNEIEREYIAKFRSYETLEDARQSARRRSNRISKATDIVLRYYQKQAIQKWEENQHVGILSIPTGMGKTLTSLYAIKPLLLSGITTLILVPTSEIFKQWTLEIKKIFPQVPILYCGSGNNWRNNKERDFFVSNKPEPKIILSTYSTASKENFLYYLKNSNKMVLVADEVHRMGSPKFRKIMSLNNFVAKIGLSATAERLFDEEGNEALDNFFGEKPFYQLSINESVQIDEASDKFYPILGTYLSKYKYYFEKINLTENEQKKWKKITKNILFLKDKKDTDSIDKLKMLYIKRSRIIKNASEKLTISNKIIRERYQSNNKWIIYCDNLNQLEIVWKNIVKEFGNTTSILKYHSKMDKEQRETTLKFFNDNPGILVSVKCLDEGVDIPEADGAIILASSINPREYIQRRGRVLRKAQGKYNATIIDTIVIPADSVLEAKIGYSIIRSEISRAYTFAKSSMNREISIDLFDIAYSMGADLEKDGDLGFESDEEVG